MADHSKREPTFLCLHPFEKSDNTRVVKYFSTQVRTHESTTITNEHVFEIKRFKNTELKSLWTLWKFQFVGKLSKSTDMK